MYYTSTMRGPPSSTLSFGVIAIEMEWINKMHKTDFLTFTVEIKLIHCLIKRFPISRGIFN